MPKNHDTPSSTKCTWLPPPHNPCKPNSSSQKLADNFSTSLSPPTSGRFPSTSLPLTFHSLQEPGFHLNSRKGWGGKGPVELTQGRLPGHIPAIPQLLPERSPQPFRELSHPWSPRCGCPGPLQAAPHSQNPQLPGTALSLQVPDSRALKLSSNSARSAPSRAELG